jgi:protein-L-isoaspartate(D-aspartate) O-methyltransferase
MHAYCLELLSDYLKPGNKVLDVGSGSGYLTAVFAHMVQPNGHVVGIEHIKELCDYSLQNIKTDNPYLLKNAEIVCGDGRKGYPEQAPYDAIHVGASSAEYPTTLIDQLNTPGRLVVPVGEEYCDQYLMVITKDKEGKITQSRAMCVMYVPLTSPEHQLG